MVLTLLATSLTFDLQPQTVMGGAGTDLQRFSLVLHIADQPPWLKAVALQFSLLRASPKQPLDPRPALRAFQLSDGLGPASPGKTVRSPPLAEHAAGSVGDSEYSDALAGGRTSTGECQGDGAISEEKQPQSRRRNRSKHASEPAGKPQFARLPSQGEGKRGAVKLGAACGEASTQGSLAKDLSEASPAADTPPTIVSCANTTSGAPSDFCAVRRSACSCTSLRTYRVHSHVQQSICGLSVCAPQLAYSRMHQSFLNAIPNGMRTRHA
jgi:hypothetical protein